MEEATRLIELDKAGKIGEAVRKVRCAQWLLCGKEFYSVVHYHGHKAFAVCPFCNNTTWIYKLYKEE